MLAFSVAVVAMPSFPDFQARKLIRECSPFNNFRSASPITSPPWVFLSSQLPSDASPCEVM